MSEGEGGGGHEGGHEKPNEGFWSVMEGIHATHGLLDVGAAAGFGNMAGAAEHLLGLGSEAAEGVEAFSGGFGGALGALNFGKGAAELWQSGGDLASSGGSQGGLDMISGGLGMAAMACPALAPVAAVAGLGAFGNEYAEEHGFYGQHQGEDGKMHNETFFGGIGHGAQDGWNAGHDLFGDNLAGDAAGAIAGGVSGAGHAIWNSGAALVGAGGRIGEGIGNAASGAWNAVSDW